MKLNRDTQPATKAASEMARVRRIQIIEEVRKKVFMDFCKCERCKNGDYSKRCMSNTEIAGTLNALKVPTTRGRVGTWQATTVKNLFRQY